MESIFPDDDQLEDLFNDNIHDENELPSGDEASAAPATESDQPIKVEPKKKIVRNPRHRLTIDTLRGSRGIHTIEDYFKDIKYHGKGHEKRDLDEIMRRLQHWAHRLYPSYKFDDVVSTIERLGKKRDLQVHMSRYRLGLLEATQATASKELNNDELDEPAMEEPFDEFDALLGEQIAISMRDPKTPSTANKRSVTTANKTFITPNFSNDDIVISTQQSDIYRKNDNDHDISDLAQPLPPSPNKLTDEQIARMAENRRIAQERLKITMARLKKIE